jgi:DNA-binding response OmpR family regulator
MATPKRIFIADDDPGILDAVAIMLEFEGYDVTTTPNGDILLNMQNNLPDLVLLDIWMSGIDGRDICRHLKLQEVTRRIPVILLSASREIERSATIAGADDFLPKPFDMDDLLKKIQKFIS